MVMNEWIFLRAGDGRLFKSGRSAVKMRMDMSQEPFYPRIYRKTPQTRWTHDRDPQFAQACAVEMHKDMSEEPFYSRIYR